MIDFFIFYAILLNISIVKIIILFMKIKKYNPAFTLVELLVVIAIISIIAVLGMVSLSNARMKSRDAKRVTDVKQVQVALEMFYNTNNRYPTTDEWNAGTIVSTSSSGEVVYFLTSIPAAPLPADGDCDIDSNAYAYTPTVNGEDYSINFCLGSKVSSAIPGNGGLLSASPLGIVALAEPAVDNCLSNPSQCYFSWRSPWSGVGYIGNSPENYGGNSYVAYIQSYQNLVRVYKYQDYYWSELGSLGFSGETGGGTLSLDVDSTGIPYIAYDAYDSYADCGNYTGGYVTNIQKYNGTSWEDVISPICLGNNVLDMAIDGSTVYIAYDAYDDFSGLNAINVLKYENSIWSQVGNKNLSGTSYEGSSPSIFADNGQVYLAYLLNSGLSDNLRVVHYNGSSWENVGTGSVAPFIVSERISFSVVNNIPYVAYSNNDGVSPLSGVSKFNGSTWDVLGGGSFPQSALSPSLVIHNNVPYVAYSDTANYGKATLIKYNGSTWNVLGVSWININSYGLHLFFINGDTPCIVHNDYFESFIIAPPPGPAT